MTAGFRPEDYAALLEATAARGYEVRTFADADPGSRHLVLRHDIDVWPGYALPIAEIEAARGARASYFVLVTSPLYNPAAPGCRAMLRRIVGLGHAVELHFDAAAHPPGIDRDAAAALECAWLESITGTPVTMISFHRPAPDLLGDPRPVAGRPHAYQPRFFSRMGYCSDSRGGWHRGQPLEHPALAAGTALQLLTHPIWWRGDASPRAALARYRADRADAVARDLDANIVLPTTAGDAG